MPVREPSEADLVLDQASNSYFTFVTVFNRSLHAYIDIIIVEIMETNRFHQLP
jgi:hypothetical protein